jgi:hypothetical protein
LGTVIGGVVGAAAGLLGKQKAPGVAPYTPVSVSQASTDAANANLQSFGANSKLAAMTNSFDLSQQQQLLEKAIPGFSAIQQRLLAQVNTDLNSQDSLPQDVQDQIARYAAEKGVSRGTSGNFNGFSLVKDFGFNLVDWQNAKRASALNTLSSVYNMAPRVSPMSPMSMFVSPNAALTAQGQNSQMGFNSAQAGLNASTAAANYNQSLWTGVLQAATPYVVQGVAKAAGVQEKVK